MIPNLAYHEAMNDAAAHFMAEMAQDKHSLTCRVLCRCWFMNTSYITFERSRYFLQYVNSIVLNTKLRNLPALHLPVLRLSAVEPNH